MILQERHKIQYLLSAALLFFILGLGNVIYARVKYKEYKGIFKETSIEINENKFKNYTVKDNILTLTLKYGQNKERVITGLKRISKPRLRVYAGADEIPYVLNGLGIAIISTPKGVMTDKLARKNNVGGEVIAYIW